MKLSTPLRQQMFVRRARLWASVFSSQTNLNSEVSNAVKSDAALVADKALAEFDNRFPVEHATAKP